ncbi:MAG: hypothetical protein ACR2GG_12165 [Gemmatimonadaceae bacterium]
MRFSPLYITAAVMLPAALIAQSTTQDTTHVKQDTSHVARDSTRPAERAEPKPAPQATVAVPINFSGILFGSYQYHAETANKDQNRFDLERAYLTFRMPAGDRASIRVTGDVFQQTSSTNGADSYYKGWVLRAKYAYLQYDFVQGKKSTDWAAVARIGLVHTMFIDHEENFWPRWLSQVPVERAGYFSSADAGLATIVTIPNKYGELYAAITNGPGYASRETDRFKDYQARLTLTPLGKSDLTYLRTLAVDGWVYRGAIASKFVNGGTGQIGPVSGGLDRNRYGVFAGIRDPRLTIGLDYAQRSDGGEGKSLNTLLSPRTVADSTGRLLSAYAVVKPFQMVNAKSSIPLGIVARFDNVKPNTSSDAHYNTEIAGLTWDLSKKTAISLDYQEQTPQGTTGIPATKVYYLHWVATF